MCGEGDHSGRPRHPAHLFICGAVRGDVVAVGDPPTHHSAKNGRTGEHTLRKMRGNRRMKNDRTGEYSLRKMIWDWRKSYTAGWKNPPRVERWLERERRIEIRRIE